MVKLETSDGTKIAVFAIVGFLAFVLITMRTCQHNGEATHEIRAVDAGMTNAERCAEMRAWLMSDLPKEDAEAIRAAKKTSKIVRDFEARLGRATTIKYGEQDWCPGK